MEKVLVTGGCGFIGSNFIKHLWGEERFRIVNLDALTYAGNPENLRAIENDPNYIFIQGDICDGELVAKVMRDFLPACIVNFAAESHVDRSLKNSTNFAMTNIIGTNTLLNAVQGWGIESFVQVGTDEVYGSLDENSPSSGETDLLMPRSPYSITKAAADLIALSHFAKYGTPVCVTRSSNNYGPNQYPEKFIPVMITNIIEGKKVPVYGEGKNVRDWIHVHDNCRAIAWVMERGILGEIYNIGGGNEIPNIELTERILRKMGFGDNWRDMVEFVKDRPGHDLRYSLDSKKIQDAPHGWMPLIPFEAGIDGTIEWYQKNREWWEPLKEKR